MIIGVPKEIKAQENRVGAVPAMVLDLVGAGNQVLVQQGAGLGAGITDEAYVKVGAKIVASAAEVYGQSDMIIKVKEPLAAEYPLIKKGQLLFTYFHFAANRELTDAMLASGAHCFAYETLIHKNSLPLLTPMSEVAGRMSVQVGAVCLEKHHGGRGILLGGVPGVEPATVLILGGGVVGTNAAKMAAGLGADVRLMDVDLDRLRYLSDVMPANVTLLHSSPIAIREQIVHADLVIGAVLVQGARAPRLIRREDLKTMKEGAVVVDVAVDQGGCIETCRPTTHADPTYVVDGVLHYCVANMPGAVARTSTFGLTNATSPWAKKLAAMGAANAAKDPVLGTAANILAGVCTHQGVAEAFGIAWKAPAAVL
ncbi:MAG: alanine dehydrogenase [Planctomycetes bacterium]|jgi:alanine dehydrogenase|nr:alanine dehydrogenase [Planctomycetota bacterium]MCC7064702.1 alanine dehydrogenase [Planctomycetota bacterium]